MSFSFTAAGTPKQAIATVGQQAAVMPQCPQAFADAINGQLAGLPENATVDLQAYGHTGFGAAQTKGEISLHVTINVKAATHPEAQPAAEE